MRRAIFAQSHRAPIPTPKAREEFNAGARAFKQGQYPQAAEHFKAAAELDPTFTTARLYLATTYMQQYIPGAEAPENLEMARAARAEFEKVLEQEPTNELAVASIASLFFNEKKLEDARQWYQKLISANAANKEAY